jgi:subtilisin-like proprotein convertase family protein
LARGWSNRPPLLKRTYSASNAQTIPDDGLRVITSGSGIPTTLQSIPSAPGGGPHADAPTAVVPIVDVGTAAGPILTDLRGKAALIQQDGVVEFSVKIENAAQAGAVFAIVYHGTSGGLRYQMGGTDFSRIPSVMIDNSPGVVLRTFANQNSSTRVQLQLNAINYSFNVPDTLVCEHVGVRIRSNHSRRGDLRITVLSPRGTRSVLQTVNLDDSAGPADWTYYSTQHFYEGSAGTWTVSVSDEEPIDTGSVLGADLIIDGVAINDTDHDGLDDGWETAYFGSLSSGPKDDADGDGYSNAVEHVVGTDPNVIDPEFRVDLSRWNDRLVRVSWPAATNHTFQVYSAADAGASFNLTTNVTGKFPEVEWFTPCTNLAEQFFRVRQ